MSESSQLTGILAATRAVTGKLLGRFLQPKPAKRVKGKGWRTDPSKVTRSLEQVARELTDLGVRRLLVQGDRAFFEQCRLILGDMVLTWSSCDAGEVMAGALNPDAVDFGMADAVICGGRQAGVCYRHAVARMVDMDLARPVLWVAENWEFCGGTMPVPAEADDCEALVFNHFQQFFGIKDPLQFRIDILHGERAQHFYRILRANESLVLRLTDFLPKIEHAACIRIEVTHPTLTRGRHHRHRACADIFWRDSFTTLHSAHEFGMSSDYKFEYRMAQSALRSGEVVLTVPNYARELGEDRSIRVFDGGQVREVERNPNAFIEEVHVARPMLPSTPYFSFAYSGYGGSFWYALETETALRLGHRGSIAANHHQGVPIAERTSDWSADEEIAQFAALREAGYMLRPHALPLTDAGHPLRFGYEFDAANPRFRDFLVYFFDARGRRLGVMPYEKQKAGPVFGDELIADWSDPAAAAAQLAVITPDWVKTRLPFKNLKKMANLYAEMRETGDRDATEYQDCWRNCGIFLDGAPHFAGPTGTVVGRTNLFGRATIKHGLRSAVLAINGSGWIGHTAPAELDLTVRDLSGRPISAKVEVEAFRWKLIWLDEILPALGTHLGEAGYGPLLVTSLIGDCNCQMVTVSDKGAVSLQHMWGY